ncbi:hypothetical protein FOZ61_003964 [Perkinsus olseni]|uniref:Uncharacterized protein n=1 Tax=Perkinsus olseni TaxID=32597 RepID=A0A7J6LN96_PEROL|nr:hypothetical protein FOZ61_003964 [Perkinsus olseni]
MVLFPLILAAFHLIFGFIDVRSGDSAASLLTRERGPRQPHRQDLPEGEQLPMAMGMLLRRSYPFKVLSALDDCFGELEKQMRYTVEGCMKSSEELRLACPRLADDRSMDEQATMTKREARLLRRQRSSSVSTVLGAAALPAVQDQERYIVRSLHSFRCWHADVNAGITLAPPLRNAPTGSTSGSIEEHVRQSLEACAPISKEKSSSEMSVEDIVDSLGHLSLSDMEIVKKRELVKEQPEQHRDALEAGSGAFCSLFGLQREVIEHLNVT